MGRKRDSVTVDDQERDVLMDLEKDVIVDNIVIPSMNRNNPKVNPAQIRQAYMNLKEKKFYIKSKDLAGEIYLDVTEQRAAELFSQHKNGNCMESLHLDVQVRMAQVLGVTLEYLWNFE